MNRPSLDAPTPVWRLYTARRPGFHSFSRSRIGKMSQFRDTTLAADDNRLPGFVTLSTAPRGPGHSGGISFTRPHGSIRYS